MILNPLLVNEHLRM